MPAVIPLLYPADVLRAYICCESDKKNHGGKKPRLFLTLYPQPRSPISFLLFSIRFNGDKHFIFSYLMQIS